MKPFRKIHVLTLAAFALLLHATITPAQLNKNANIKGTKHNLSTSGPGTTKATSEDQICVFCHTPHAANSTAPAPLWNRKMGGASADANTYVATYSPYQSNSLDTSDATMDINGIKTLPPPGGASKLCLSCHDGTLALGTVGVLDGKANPTTIAGLTGTMPTGEGVTTGFTRNLGVNLRNDHPISFTFDSNLATRDGEFRSPPYTESLDTVVAIRSASVKPMLPLDHEGKVQCTSCHDPHLEASKFLRLNRFQKTSAPGLAFDADTDQICLGCHDKLQNGWAQSVHANPNIATQPYKTGVGSPARLREFPESPAIQVWEAACLNCHDTHAVQGSRRLLREGTDSASTPKAGGNSAIEQTCYQCHTTTAASIVTVATMTSTTGIPDIKTEFTTRSKYMPIAITTEKHDLGGDFNDAGFVDCSGASNKCGADFIEARSRLGAGNLANRHVECTDCHNPHRVVKNSRFTNDGVSSRRTHSPGGADGNIASGALRGTWGVEPGWSASGDWPELPGYTVKRGDPKDSALTGKGQAYLTREYQLCLKCHSDYGFGTTAPDTGYTGGSTSNSIGSKYTNIAAELSVNALDTPTAGKDQGEEGTCGTNCTAQTDIEPSGSFPGDTLSSEMTDLDLAKVTNHRSWHPIHYPTGRNFDERRISDTTSPNFRAPFLNVGAQTMHCSDCHGNGSTWTQGSGPDLAKVQGPHGSSNDFILRGGWSTSTTITGGSTQLCYNCHNPTGGTTGVGDNGTGRTSGFNDAGTNGGGGHANEHGGAPCMRCHVAVPHGWKNKALLVNLNCRGPEGAAAAGACDPTSGYANYPSRNGRYTNGPYYVESFLRVRTWVPSGNWSESRCGRSGSDGTGEKWMNDGGYCN